ncbi:D-alanyl-D-alanine carboxypeptidase, partial [Streptomyces sp. T-3]|nr:D-alanyl-D-alanine carboxypeptidase [Streptomyces sp. T-3]
AGEGPGDGAEASESGEGEGAGASGEAQASDESAASDEPAVSGEAAASDQDGAEPEASDEAAEEPETSDEEGEPTADAEGAEPSDGSGDEGDAAEAEAEASGDANAKPEASDTDDVNDAEGTADADDDSGDANAESEPESSAPAAPGDQDAEPAAEPAAEIEDETGSKGEGDAEDAEEPAEGKPVDRATAVFKTLPKSAEGPADDKPADAEPDDAKPVDQATAVFKAVAPKSSPAAPKPPVDQPTAMLKLPKPDAEEQAEGKGEAGPGPESPAERTSKFVALKPLDGPAAPKAPKPETPRPAEEAKPAAKAAPDHVGPERTRQQPLPPKPPLDLLAELTNTPPPPQTAIRTTVRRVKIWTPLVLLLLIAFAIAQVVRPLPSPTLSLTAQEKVSFEGGKPQIPWPDQGQAALDVEGIGSFGTYGEQKPVPIASIAKVMTAYVILKEHPIKGEGGKGATIPVDKQAEEHYVSGKKDNESVVDVKEGEKLSEYEAIQALMLPSANNVAKLLARWDSDGDEKAFVQKMNDTAKKLGMKNTTYTDASGLDKTTVSTAEDLVKLGRAAMEIPVFKQIVGQRYYTPTNGRGDPNCMSGTELAGKVWCNFNNLVPTVAVGIKTGTTTAAGGNLLFASKKTVDGQEQIVIGAALAQFAKHTQANIDEVTANSRKLMEAAEAALTSKTIVKKGDVVGHVDNGLGGTTPVVATKDVKAVGWPGLTVRLDLGTAKGKTIPHSAKAGTVVGELSVGDGKAGGVKVPVALQSAMAEPGFGEKLTRIG